MRKIVIIVAIIASLIGLSLAVYLYTNPGLAAPAGPAPIRGEANSSSALFLDMEVNQPAADFTLINQDEKTISLDDYRGSFVVLDFIYTSCPDVCPMMTANLRRVENKLGNRFGQSVHFISITVDPEYDTPERLKAYAEAYGIKDSDAWAFLTGEPDTVGQVLEAYHQTVERKGPRDVDHTALTVLIDPSGVERHRYWGSLYPPQLVVEHIETLSR